jgi:hypothetical protein
MSGDDALAGGGRLLDPFGVEALPPRTCVGMAT